MSKKKKYTDEELLDFIKKLAEELGKTPRSVDMDSKVGFPSRKTFDKRFGSWNNALKLSGFSLNTNFSYTKEDIQDEIRLFYKENSRSPFYYEISFSNTAWRNYWESWNDVLEDCGLPVNKQCHNFKTLDDGIIYLKDLAKRLNRIPFANDVDRDGVNRNWFTNKFGSWKDALFSSGLIDEYELNNSFDNMANNSIEYLISLSKSIDRVPTVEEYEEYLSTQRKNSYLTRRNLCNRLDKTYLEICEFYLPQEVVENHTRFLLNKEGKLCRSVAELNISNLIIDNNLKLQYEPLYSEFTNGRYKYRFDWSIEDIYIEYFGLFQEKTYDSGILEDYKRKAYIKTGICKIYNIKLISLFPSDLQDNYKGLINKFKEHNIVLSLKDQNKIS